MSQRDTLNFALSPCPNCGALAEERQVSSFFRGAYGVGTMLLVAGKKRSLLGSKPIIIEPTPVICVRCGYVQLFVNPDDFRGEAE